MTWHYSVYILFNDISYNLFSMLKEKCFNKEKKSLLSNHKMIKSTHQKSNPQLNFYFFPIKALFPPILTWSGTIKSRKSHYSFKLLKNCCVCGIQFYKNLPFMTKKVYHRWNILVLHTKFLKMQPPMGEDCPSYWQHQTKSFQEKYKNIPKLDARSHL